MAEQKSENRLQSILATLNHLGWNHKKTPSINFAKNDTPVIDSELKSACWTVLHLPTDQTLVIVSTEKSLHGFEDSYKKFEDLTTNHRLILSWLEIQHLSYDFLLILDEHGGSLLNHQSEEILLHTQNRREMEERLLPLLSLSSVTTGALESYPGKTNRRHGQELRCWTEYWATEIGTQINSQPADVSMFFESIHMTRLALKLNLIEGEKESLFTNLHQFKDLKPSLSTIKKLMIRLQESSNFLHLHPLSKDESLWQSSNFHDCMRSYSVLCTRKFSSTIFAEAFSDQELQEVSAKAVLQERATVERDSTFDLESWNYSPTTFDLDSKGTSLLLRNFDSLIQEVIEDSRKQRASLERGERPGTQLDLLADEPPIPNEKDAPSIILKHGLDISTSLARRRQFVRNLLLARAAEWYAKLQVKTPIFPAVKINLNKDHSAPQKLTNPVAAFQNYHLN